MVCQALFYAVSNFRVPRVISRLIAQNEHSGFLWASYRLRAGRGRLAPHAYRHDPATLFARAKRLLFFCDTVAQAPMHSRFARHSPLTLRTQDTRGSKSRRYTKREKLHRLRAGMPYGKRKVKGESIFFSRGKKIFLPILDFPFLRMT